MAARYLVPARDQATVHRRPPDCRGQDGRAGHRL